MLASPLGRGAVLVLLLAGLLGLGVWYGSLDPAPAVGAYPAADDLAADYDRYVGDRATIAGRVVATDPVVVATSDGAGGTVRYRLRGLDRPAATGETVWALVTVAPGHTLQVERATVVPPEGYDYARGISLLAGLWVLARVLGDWRLDREVVGLVPRNGAAGPVPSGGDDGGETDA